MSQTANPIHVAALRVHGAEQKLLETIAIAELHRDALQSAREQFGAVRGYVAPVKILTQSDEVFSLAEAQEIASSDADFVAVEGSRLLATVRYLARLQVELGRQKLGFEEL
jgi:hypothetical protein